MPPTFITGQPRPASSEFTLSHGIFILLVLLLIGSFFYQAFSPYAPQAQSRSESGAFLGSMANVQDSR